MTSGKIDQKRFDWTDPLDFTARLTEEERMISESARAYAREKAAAAHRLGLRRGAVRSRGALRDGRARPARHYATGRVRRVRCRPRRLRAGHARDRGGRFRLSLGDERAILAGDVPDPVVRLGGAEAEVPAQDGARRDDRLLRPHRGRRRLRPCLDAHQGREGRRRLRAERLEILDLQLAGGPTSRWSGPSSMATSTASWSSAAPKASPPTSSATSSRCAPPSPGDIGLSDVFVPEENRPARRARPARPVLVPQQGTLRHRLGLARARPGILLPTPRATT